MPMSYINYFPGHIKLNCTIDKSVYLLKRHTVVKVIAAIINKSGEIGFGLCNDDQSIMSTIVKDRDPTGIIRLFLFCHQPVIILI